MLPDPFLKNIISGKTTVHKILIIADYCYPLRKNMSEGILKIWSELMKNVKDVISLNVPI